MEFIIMALFGDYSSVAEQLEKELDGTPKQTVETVCIEKLSKDELIKMVDNLSSEIERLTKENSSLKENKENARALNSISEAYHAKVEECKILKEAIARLIKNINKCLFIIEIQESKIDRLTITI